MPDITIFDCRGKDIAVGDTVCYVSRPEIHRQSFGNFNIIAGLLIHSKVVDIEHFPGTGFAEIGDTIKVRLENGYVATGDAENGGWGLWKLEQDDRATIDRDEAANLVESVANAYSEGQASQQAIDCAKKLITKFKIEGFNYLP